MAVLKRKAAEVNSVPVENKFNLRRKVGAIKTKLKPKMRLKPVTFGSGKIWTRGDKIGRGGYASVFIAYFRSCQVDQDPHFPKAMAVKSCSLETADSVMRELQVYREMECASCPFIIGHYGEECTLSSEGEEIYNLGMLIAWGSLAKKMNDNFPDENLPEGEARRYTGDILRGLNHIHDRGYVHCDMKPENVLLVESVGEDGKEMLVAKVGDLGMVKKEFDGGWGGTPSYLAPETVYDRKQERASDIWAVGLIVLEMLTGECPLRVIYENEDDCFCVVESMHPLTNSAQPFTSNLFNERGRPSAFHEHFWLESFFKQEKTSTPRLFQISKPKGL